MILPQLFRDIHGSKIFNIWTQKDHPRFVSIIPQEPLKPIELGPDIVLGDTVTIVTIRCWNDRGTMQFEAATRADLTAAQEWAERHKATPAEDFKWLPLKRV